MSTNAKLGFFLFVMALVALAVWRGAVDDHGLANITSAVATP